MKKCKFIHNVYRVAVMSILFGGALVLTPFTASAAGSEEGEEGMIDKMISMQYFTQKVGLSLRASNFELADFYLHEMEELMEELAEIDSYDGYPIGKLTPAMLGPSVEKLEDAVDDRDAALALKTYSETITACNACHLATGKQVIRIVDRSTEPHNFLQDFQPVQ